jgi:lipoprotein-releasing system permease protein
MVRDWIFFVGYRYLRTRRREKGLAPAALSVIGIAVGVMTLITVMGVMNGFQLGFIENILEISSFHLQAAPIEKGSGLLERDDILQIKGVKSVLPYKEFQTMMKGRFPSFRPVNIRGIPIDWQEMDPGMDNRLEMVKGDFAISPGTSSIVIGQELAQAIGVGVGDQVSLISLSGKGFSLIVPATVHYQVSGLFHSGYYEIDSSFAFVELSTFQEINREANLTYGIKLENRFNDTSVLENLNRQAGIKANSWKVYNRSFFSALRMEKIVMMILIGLIFLVVGVNIFHALRRSVYEKREEIAVLRSLGASPSSIRGIFLIEGVLIGFMGALIGTILGLLLSSQINSLFRGTEYLINLGIDILNILASWWGGSKGHMSLFSPAYFYIQEIPSRVLFGEVLLITGFALFSSILAAHVAASKISEIKPSEVLRYE